MRRFQDTTGRTWEIAINVSALKRVRSLLQIDLLKLIDDGFKPLTQLLSDPVALCDLLYCLCEEQAHAQQISDEQFGRGLGGDALLQASEAFIEELIDFFPDAPTRSSLREVIRKGRRVQELLFERAHTLLSQIDPEVEVSRWLNSSGNSPASSGSIPARSP